MSRKLQYFNINGFAEAIRYILHYGRLEFEDVRHNHGEWPIQSIKEALPYGQMPLYEEDGRVFNQSMAIARYVASQVGLVPSDPWEQAKLDAAALNVYDMLYKLRSNLIETDPKKIEDSKKTELETIDFYLLRFEKELKDGNGHFGGKLTWADFILVGAIEILNLYLDDPPEKNYPNIKALISNIHSQNGVKEYVAKRTPYRRLRN